MGAQARVKAQQFDQAVMISQLSQVFRQLLAGGA